MREALDAQDLAASVADEIRTVAGKDAEVWAVTHSLGGIVLRHIMGLADSGESVKPCCNGYSANVLYLTFVHTCPYTSIR